MPIGFCVRLVASAIAGLLAAASVAAAQESVEQFYKGKSIDLRAFTGADNVARLTLN